MDDILFEKLQQEGLLSAESLQKIKAHRSNHLFSLHWEIRGLLYLGVLLLTGGLGILVYKNIETISHQAILLFIAIVCTGSFYYCFKRSTGFSNEKVVSPSPLFDYILLLGCISLVIFIGYIQYQYNVFGNRLGLAGFIPMLVLFASAYYFDNLAILSMAITNLAAWMGITVTPVEILKANDFNNSTIIFTGLLLGLLLISAAIFSKGRGFKKHFEFTYNNFGMHVIFISCLAAMFEFERIYLLLFVLLLGIAWYFYQKALKERSFYMILVTSLYSYIGISYIFLRLIDMIGGLSESMIYMCIFYFIGSGILMAMFLINTNKKLKRK